MKYFLQNVYFVCGTPCGGKTTISRMLSKMYGIPVYDIDERFPEHQKQSDAVSQPAMNREFRDADEFFGRSVEEYKAWLRQNTREQLDFVLLDLIRLSQNGPVLCDCHFTLKEASLFTEPSRIAFMMRRPEELVEEYCNRPDHQGFADFIHSDSDYEKAKATCNETLRSLNEQFYEEVHSSSYFYLDRDLSRSPEETAELVARHFGFQKDSGSGKKHDLTEENETDKDLRTNGNQYLLRGDLDLESEEDTKVQIIQVEKDTPLAAELLNFAEHCSWEEVREHLTGQIRDWEFTGWEAIFAAVSGQKIVGITTLLKEDYYPLPDIFPWVSTIFVEEAFRGDRISEKLIDAANTYAKSRGFSKTYIPGIHTGLYEKYGYTYVKDIVNYGGDTDRLYEKDLI